MDTDDLTEMAYETLTQAHAVCDVLRAGIGASATSFKTEDEFLRGTLEFLDGILADPEEYLESWNLLGDKIHNPLSKGFASCEIMSAPR